MKSYSLLKLISLLLCMLLLLSAVLTGCNDIRSDKPNDTEGTGSSDTKYESDMGEASSDDYGSCESDSDETESDGDGGDGNSNSTDTYTVKYVLDGGYPSAANPSAYTSQDETITIYAPIKTGYTFIGWTYDGQTEPRVDVKIERGSSGNKIFTANWSANTYTVSFNTDGGHTLSDMQVTFHSQYSLPTPTRTGYSFDGWYLNGSRFVSGNVWTISDNIALKAKWSVNRYNITYDLQGGEYFGSDFYTYGDEIALPAPTRTGYKFIGWTYEGQTTPTENVTIPAGSTGDKTLTAHWAACAYTVTFDANGGGAIDDIEVTYGLPYTLPTPEWVGHQFDGWFCDGVKWTDGEAWTRTEGLDLTATWSLKNYTITYSLGGGTQTDPVTSYTCEDEVTLVAPTRDGYEFIGWTYEGQTTPTKDVTVPAGSTGNKVYTANWRGRLAFLYNDRDGYVTVTGIGTCEGEENIVIPAAFNGRYIGKIADNAFLGCSYIKSITFEENDRFYIIGDSAFEGCTSLRNIDIPKGINSIGTSAFKNCTALESITIPARIESIDPHAFSNCSALLSISFEKDQGIEYGSNLTTIGERAFEGCTGLTSVTLPASVTTLERGAFVSCSSIKTVIFEQGSVLTTIGFETFDNCTSLEKINIPASVTSVGSYAFNNCDALIRVYYGGASVTEWNTMSKGNYGNDYFKDKFVRFYYSEDSPSTTGLSWHFVNGIPTDW